MVPVIPRSQRAAADIKSRFGVLVDAADAYVDSHSLREFGVFLGQASSICLLEEALRLESRLYHLPVGTTAG